MHTTQKAVVIVLKCVSFCPLVLGVIRSHQVGWLLLCEALSAALAEVGVTIEDLASSTPAGIEAALSMIKEPTVPRARGDDVHMDEEQKLKPLTQERIRKAVQDSVPATSASGYCQQVVKVKGKGRANTLEPRG
eukprot:3782751-Amphidinium_carterae.1